MSARKKIQREVQKLIAEIHEQIWFPENSTDGYIFRYGISLLLGLVTVVYILFSPTEAKTSAFLLFSFSIALSSFLGNMKNALFLLMFAVSALFFRYYGTTNFTLYYFVELGSLVASALGISALIQNSKRMKIVEEFAQKEQVLKGKISKLSEEKAHALKEIQVRDEFISIASHELKTPLTTTLLKLQTALHNVRHVTLANFSVQSLLDMLESAELQTIRLGKMINDLLNISIIRTGRLELELEDCDARELVQEVVHRFTEKAGKDGITLHVEAKSAVKGKFDRVRLEQVIANLISNALKYGKGKPVFVTVEKTRNFLRVKVRDNGIGIPADKKDNVFNLFERAVGNNEYKGLGIGLYITKQIVVAHKGTMHVDSKLNKGSEFVVEIPLS